MNMRRIARQFTPERWRRALQRRLGRPAALRSVRWEGTDSLRLAADALAYRAAAHVSPGDGWVLLLGDGGELQRRAAQSLARTDVDYRTVSLEDIPEVRGADTEHLQCIVSGLTDARQIHQAARALRDNSALADVPFEYVVGLEPERQVMRELDEYANARFVSPAYIDRIDVHRLYADSLTRFEQKCGLRDFLDLYQCLRNVAERKVPGDIAEFGSYQGHSGYLIACVLRELAETRRLFLFDTFDRFPTERLGVDRFWSGTHAVDFDAVRNKFADFDNVVFERGDFAQTLDTSPLGQIALAYVDCDSYRAVRYLTERLWDERLSPGGMLVFEDYGHPALLGCREAIHEFFDGRDDCVRWYSEFSGLYFTVKLPRP